jgi:hypothetical protein
MKMASSTISELRSFVRWQHLLPSVNGCVERLEFSSYGPLDLASPYQFWICSHGCREKVCPRKICPDCYVLGNGDSYSRLFRNVDQTVRLLFLGILVLILLQMVIDYVNGCARARSLGIAAQIKIIWEPSLVFTCLWFGFSSVAFINIQDCVIEEERVQRPQRFAYFF